MNIGIVGLGLIGGSLGRAILKKTQHTVFGYDIDPNAIIKALMLNAISQELTPGSLSQMDIVVVALPPKSTLETLEKMANGMKPDAILIDCCGDKRIIIDKMSELQKTYPHINYIGVHPMAGKEFNGISHSSASLFDKAYIIAVPVHTQIAPLSIIKQLFLDIGAEQLVISSANEHDSIIAYTSQLAHIISSAYIKSPMAAEHLGFSAGSFKDLTRVARLDPNMWTELMMANSDYLIKEIDVLQKSISEYREALAATDAETLKKLLAEGSRCKDYAESLRKEKKQHD